MVQDYVKYIYIINKCGEIEMNINLNRFKYSYDESLFKKRSQELNQLQGTKKLKGNNLKASKQEGSRDDKLRLLADEFTSILMKQMLKSMRKTVPEGKLIDGGFSEDVFKDMYDEKISKLGMGQNGYNTLSKLLYEQIKK